MFGCAPSYPEPLRKYKVPWITYSTFIGKNLNENNFQNILTPPSRNNKVICATDQAKSRMPCKKTIMPEYKHKTVKKKYGAQCQKYLKTNVTIYT